jgi:phosphoribosylformylglycinamidine (FGAM) synthase-like amidotransferase family enzyme
MRPLALIPQFVGNNCQFETDEAATLAGARAEIVLYSQLRSGRRKLTEADLVILPGGFSFGDHFGAGRVAAFEMVQVLFDQLQELKQRRVPILGECNGFQVLVAAGLLPGDGEIGKPTAILDMNLSANFEYWAETRLVLHASAANCLWTKDLDGHAIRLPVAHGEGRLVTGSRTNVVGTYGTSTGVSTYPKSPNGSRVAGICNSTGDVVGFMPHFTRRIDKRRGGDQGLQIFRNGVKAVK